MNQIESGSALSAFSLYIGALHDPLRSWFLILIFVVPICKHLAKFICRPLCGKILLGNFSIQNITFDTEVRAIMTFGEMVKYARKQLSMTQTELAKALGVSFATVNRWENGQVNPSSLAQKAFEDFCESSFISFPRE